MSREAKRAQERDEQRDEQRAERQPTDTGAAPAAREPARRERTSPPQFLREVRGELKKVAWPNRREVVSYSLVVLITTLVLTLFTFGLDELIRNALINFLR
jgi:preprotein translocase subunit SecE